jgi:predicted amidohydrolase YtcJ
VSEHNMTEAADLLLTNAAVHTLTRPDETHEAVAVRDGRIVRVGTAYELDFLAGVGTERIDLDGRPLLPGFVDAHTHLDLLGRHLVHADLSGAESREAALDALRARAAEVGEGEPVLGFGYDESAWEDGGGYLDRSDLDAADADGPVVAVREDLHVAGLDSAALSQYGDDLPADGRTDEEGVVVEAAVRDLLDAVDDGEDVVTRLRAAQAHAVERGVAGVHDVVRDPGVAAAYRALDRSGDLNLRVRLIHHAAHLDALVGAGLRTGDGTGMVRVGAIKAFVDGSIGARTARLSTPYADAPGERGEWATPPAELAELVDRAGAAGFQVAVHAIGDEAVDAAVAAFDGADPDRRHRLEHCELAGDEAIARMADRGLVASVQPNFHRWAGDGGLYATRLGDRWRETNRLRKLADAGVPLSFGSDCMPLDPLVGVHHAVNAPTDDGRVSVTEALRAYTRGAAYAGFDEGRIGTIERGKCADLVALERSPWEGEVADIDVALTVVDGEVAYDGIRSL